MVKFTVDPTTLADLSSSISGVHNQMQSMHGVATSYEGLLGGSDLEGEVESFCSHWSYGITCLSHDMATVVAALDNAANNYDKNEQTVVNACASE